MRKQVESGIGRRTLIRPTKIKYRRGRVDKRKRTHQKRGRLTIPGCCFSPHPNGSGGLFKNDLYGFV
jgi:hypothetical protein